MKAERDATRQCEETPASDERDPRDAKENNRMLEEHNSTVRSIAKRVRRIGVNISNMR
ncbi:MAG TPA: hypothetical protein VJZ68_00860 [Nitrososphaera sp.]|nr:hypothetical protein [Nitrososphaera sp.]